MNSVPKVTVLMPVYNGEKYLREAIDSVLSQTFKDFEFLIINDGSSDSSEEIIKSYQDNRIILVNNKTNIKLIDTLNKGLELAKGEYIVRMDCDDICFNNRLEIQVAYMDSHREVGVCGSWIELFGDIKPAIIKNPTEDEDICIKLLFENIIAHPSVIIRNEYIKKFGLKYPNIIHVEDWAFWLECSKHFKIGNIGKPLLKYRISSNSITQLYRDKMQEGKKIIIISNINGILKNSVKAEETYENIFVQTGTKSTEFINKLIKSARELISQNEKIKKYDKDKFEMETSELVFKILSQLGIKSIATFYRANPKTVFKLPFIFQIKYIIRCLLRNIITLMHERVII